MSRAAIRLAGALAGALVGSLPMVALYAFDPVRATAVWLYGVALGVLLGLAWASRRIRGGPRSRRVPSRRRDTGLARMAATARRMGRW